MWVLKQKKWQHAKTIGNKGEAIIRTMALESGLTIIEESVVDNAKRRKKGNVDHIYQLSSELNFNNEIKWSNDGKYTFSPGSEKHDIKWSQIMFLRNRYKNHNEESGITFMAPSKNPVFVHIKDLMTKYANDWVKHIKYEEARKIGIEYIDMDWVKGYEYKPRVIIDENITPIEKILEPEKVDKPVNKIQIGMKLDIF